MENVGNAETTKPKFGVREVVIEKPEIKITLLCPQGSKDGCEYVRKVKSSKSEWVWVKENYPEFSQGRYLHQEEGDNHYVVIITKSVVRDVYDIKKMPNYQLVNLDGYPVYEGRGMKVVERIQLKKDVARKFGLSYELLPDEQFAQTILNKEHAEKRQQEIEAKRRMEEEAKQLRMEENKKIRDRIFARPRIKGYANGNRWWNGVPVTESEWQKLPDDSYCVLVASYNDEEKTHGAILGTFKVKKDGAKKWKTDEGEFSRNETKMTPVVKVVGQIGYKDKDGDICTAFVYGSTSDIKNMQASGLNSGAVVAVKGDGEKVFNLYRVSKAKVTSVGSVEGTII